MSLPELANLVVVATPDPNELAHVRARIEASGAFDATWSPSAGRIVAVSSFDGSAPGENEERAAGIAFAEGRDEVAGAGWEWSDVARLVTSRPEALEELPGDFGLVGIGPEGDLTVVRSAAGRVPFYIAGGDGRWTVATTLHHLLRFHVQDLELDPLVNAIWTSGYDAAPDRRTFLAGVSVLGRGEYARLDGSRLEFGRWWDPRGSEAPAPSGEHAERLRAALVNTLERELDPQGGNLLPLSGGVDSSALGALAAGLLGRDVGTLTVVPDNDESAARDLRYVAALDGEVGFQRRKVVRLDRELRLELLDEPKVPFHVTQPYLCLVPSATREWPDWPVSVLFGGEFADHTVGSMITLRDWARHTSALGLLRSRHALPTGPIDLRRWFVYRLRRMLRRPHVAWPPDLPALVRPELREEYRDWFVERRRAAARDEGPMAYLAMQLECEGFLGMNWELTSGLGVRRCYPFVTRELLELAFQCHPSELVGPGTKLLLRTALAGDVPAFNLERPDKGHPGRIPGSGARIWSGEVPSVLHSVLRPGWPPPVEIEYWDVFRLRQLIAFARGFGHSRAGSSRAIVRQN